MISGDAGPSALDRDAAHRVFEASPPASGTPPRYPIRGRDGEIECAVDALLRTANSGKSGVVLLTGEPGIGKTALLGAIAERAREVSFGVGVGKAEESDQIAPLAPLLVALRSGSVPLLSRSDFNELAPLCHQPLWLVDRLTRMLEKRACAAPLLIGIDDVQWADALSIFALRVMPVHLAGYPIVWLLATRPRPAHPAKEIRAVLAADVAIREINVGPLTPEAIDELAHDRHGEPPHGRLRRLLHGAQGYPFLAVELLDGISRDRATSTGGYADDGRAQEAPRNRELPDRLIAGVRSRLERLSDESLRLIQIASIFGRSFFIEDAAELLHVTPATKLVPSIQAAVRAGVLTDDGDRLAFRHDLLRQAVYEDVPQAMRISLHRAAAQRALATGRGALEAAPHVLAYAHRGDREAIDVLRTAASALTVTIPAVSAQLIERAFSLLEPGDADWDVSGALLAQVRADNDRRCDSSNAIETGFAQMWHDYGLGMLDDTEADAETLLQLCDDLREHGDALEARIMLSRVQRLMQTAGVRRRGLAPATLRPREGWAALTVTEERVARLIAEGHTNRSAAQQLVLSPNTVATHLRSIFGKLAVNSRSQLTRVVMSRPPPER